MAQYKTPGVYVVEKNAFPNSVVEVATAVPAFIGYTETADNKGTSLAGKPWRITSMAEFMVYFGSAPKTKFSFSAIAAPSAPATDNAADSAGKASSTANTANVPADFSVTELVTKKRLEYALKTESTPYILFYSMLLFFQNGGGPCYIVSVGTYKDDLDATKITAGIDSLLKEQEPTIVVVPDAVHLSEQDCTSVQQAALMHCGFKMRNRVAILDIYNGYRDRQDPAGDCVAEFRETVGSNFLDFGAAYYPWVNTSIVKEKDVDFTSLTNCADLADLIGNELGSLPGFSYGAAAAAPAAAPAADGTTPAAPAPAPAAATGNSLALTDKKPNKAAQVKLDQLNAALNELRSYVDPAAAKASATDAAADASAPAKDTSKDPVIDILTLNKTLLAVSALYPQIVGAIQKRLNLLPPSAGMAGLYTMVDNSRGVWKAPANVSMNGVVSPTVSISNEEQEDLNVTTQGKSINAIRTFIGEGVLVWGARTLDGNSLDWRYVSVRRTMIMIEESIKQACKAYVFEPNTANTWVTIKSMVRNFLTSVWKRGGLAGASADDAFSVFVGLGETMTADDILEGLMKVTVLVAVSRPAEFIEITFQQQMQKS